MKMIKSLIKNFLNKVSTETTEQSTEEKSTLRTVEIVFEALLCDDDGQTFLYLKDSANPFLFRGRELIRTLKDYVENSTYSRCYNFVDVRAGAVPWCHNPC